MFSKITQGLGLALLATLLLAGCGGGGTTVAPAQPTFVSIAVRQIPSSTATSMTAGTTQQYNAIGTRSDGSTQDLTTAATWSSSNTTVATVNASGVVTGLKGGGPLTLTATYAGISGTASLTVIWPAEGAITIPAAINMPHNGYVNTVASYYVYTTVGTVNTITMSNLTGDVFPNVFTNGSYTTLSGNWACTTSTAPVTTNTCTATTPVPANTALYIKASSINSTIGATYTLSVSNLVNEGAINAPLVIALPYNGMVGAFGNSYYAYTTTATTSLITALNMNGNVDPKVFTTAVFATIDANWICTINTGITNDTCTATTPVPAGTVLYIRMLNLTGAGATFRLQ